MEKEMENKLVKKIDHLGIAVNSLEETIPFYENLLGVKCEHIEEVVEQKVKTAFFDVGGVHIELLEPTSEDSPVAKFIEKKGQGIHHLAFAVDDTAKALEGVAQSGVKLIDSVPRKGAGGKDIGFLHPKATFGVLTELCSGGEH